MNYPYPWHEFSIKILWRWLTVSFGDYQWLDGSRLSFIASDRGDYSLRFALWGWYLSFFVGKPITQAEIEEAHQEAQVWRDLFEGEE